LFTFWAWLKLLKVVAHRGGPKTVPLPVETDPVGVVAGVNGSRRSEVGSFGHGMNTKEIRATNEHE
jgi:hypothetical protein